MGVKSTIGGRLRSSEVAPSRQIEREIQEALPLRRAPWSDVYAADVAGRLGDACAILSPALDRICAVVSPLGCPAEWTTDVRLATDEVDTACEAYTQGDGSRDRLLRATESLERAWRSAVQATGTPKTLAEEVGF